jgi:hypothetical protein
VGEVKHQEVELSQETVAATVGIMEATVAVVLVVILELVVVLVALQVLVAVALQVGLTPLRMVTHLAVAQAPLVRVLLANQ